MSTHDYIIADAAGSAFLADLNLAVKALAENNSSATEPAVMYAHMWWADTTADILKKRNAANTGWISYLTLSTGAPLVTSGTWAGNAATATTAVSLSVSLESIPTIGTASSSIWGPISNTGINSARINYAGTHTTTLPSAATYDNATIRINSYNGAVISASSNVTPISGAAAGTAILSGAGKWARMVSDGTTWVIVEAN